MTPTDYGLKYGEYFYEPNSGMTKIHAKGTVVKLSQKYIESRTTRGENIYDYAEFSHIYNADGEFCYVFYKCLNPIKNRTFNNNFSEMNKFYKGNPDIFICPSELDYAIEEYIRDVVYDVNTPEFRCMQKDWKIPGMMRAWGILIIIMIASMVIKGFPVLWVIELLIFNAWRSDFINK
jgi:hypothetical protein